MDGLTERPLKMAALPALRAEAGLAAFTVRLDASPLPAGVAAALREDGVVVLVLEDDGYLVDFYARAEASYHAFFARPEGDKERVVGFFKALVVVYEPRGHTQRFLAGHDAEVRCS